MALAEKISRQPSTGWVAWLLVALLLQIYNEKEQTEKGNTKCTVGGEREEGGKSLKKSLVLNSIKEL